VRRLRAILGAAVAFGLLISPASAAPISPGSLDTSFASVGYVTNNMVIQSLVVQPDHKVVVAGDVWRPDGPHFGIYRYQADGALDPAFGSKGRVVMDQVTAGSSMSVALQADGRLLVSGQLDGRVSLSRFLSNGALDPSFSGDGRRLFKTSGAGLKVQVDPAGAIDILVDNFGTDGVLQVMPNGSVNQAFGKHGLATVGCEGAGDNGMALQGRKILVAGDRPDSHGSDFCVQRVQPNGTISPTFGTGGLPKIGFANSARAAAVAYSGAARTITVVGTVDASTPDKSYTALARLHLNGSLDTSFGTGGRVVTTDRQLGIRSSDGEGLGVVMDGTDTVLVGFTHSAQWEVVRYTSSGALDKGFGAAGLIPPTFTGNAMAEAVAMDGSRIVVGGLNNPDEEFDIAPDGGLARYHS
jgi:uncharacterized delta-60 repeat protein